MSKLEFSRFEEKFSASKMTKADLARALDVRTNTLQAWFERCTVPPKYLYSIANILKVNPMYLAGETNDPTRTYIAPLIGSETSEIPMLPIDKNKYKGIARDFNGENVYAIKCETEFMNNTILKGSLCLCNPDDDIHKFDVVHYNWGVEKGIARYRLSADKMTIVLAPDNNEFSPIAIPWDSDIELNMVKIFRVENDL